MSPRDDQPAEVMVPIEQDTIAFYGHELVAVRLADGRIAAVLNWLFESLDLNRAGQMQRIERKTALHEQLVPVRVQTEGGPQTMLALTLKGLPGWLFSMEEHRVRPEARDDLVIFQRECVDVLAEHFARKHAAALPAPAAGGAVALSDPRVAQLVEQIDTLTGAVGLMREHLAALLPLPGQVQGLSDKVDGAVAMLEALADRQGNTEAQVARIDERTQRLTPAHAQAVRELVDHLVSETARLPVPLTYPTVYGRLKRRFRASSYREIADELFAEVMAYLRDELQRAGGGGEPAQGALF
jgi:hypothetical protein